VRCGYDERLPPALALRGGEQEDLSLPAAPVTAAIEMENAHA
jgi:hypothetical protein